MRKQNPVRRLTSELYNTPHLISPLAFSSILTYLHQRNAGMMSNDIIRVDDEMDKSTVVGKIGLIDVHGGLTNKPMESLCGATGASYSGILGQTADLIAVGCKTIVMDIESGGGEAFNCFQSAEELRAMCDASGVKLIAYVQSVAASAAYALACVADEVICHPGAKVGSIGVLIELYNESEYLKKEGISRTYVYSGANKIPYDADGKFTEAFISSLQSDTDHLYANFCAHVSKHTGLTVGEVVATEASCFRAEQALELGLVNSIMNNQEFLKYLTAKEV